MAAVVFEATMVWESIPNSPSTATTAPADAAPGTIRKEFALNIGENSVHGSDSLENAAREIAFFFSEIEIVG